MLHADVGMFDRHLSTIVDLIVPHRMNLSDDPFEVHQRWLSRRTDDVAQRMLFCIATDWLAQAFDPSAPNTETFITFIITNGEAMLAHQGGKRLFYSTWKNQCSDRDHCPSYSPCCEAKSTNGFINHLLFSSEPLQGENVWIEMAPGQMLGVDGRMRLQDIEMPNMAATWI